MGWAVWGMNPGWGEIFTPVRAGSGAHPASYTVGTGSFPGVKRLGSGVGHPPPSSAKVKERIQLYLHSTPGPLWPVTGWTLLFTLPFVLKRDILVENGENLRLAYTTRAIPKSTSDWLVKKIQNREQNFIVWSSYVHNCITSPHSCHPHVGACHIVTLVFVVPRQRRVLPSYAASCWLHPWAFCWCGSAG